MTICRGRFKEQKVSKMGVPRDGLLASLTDILAAWNPWEIMVKVEYVLIGVKIPKL